MCAHADPFHGRDLRTIVLLVLFGLPDRQAALNKAAAMSPGWVFGNGRFSCGAHQGSC